MAFGKSWFGSDSYFLNLFLIGGLPGSSPGGSREIRRVNSVGEESLFIWKYKIKLGRNRVVGKFSGEKSLNNLVYGESQ